MAPNYSDSKIYKLVNHVTGEILYIGSTTQHYLCQRMACHRSRTRDKKHQYRQKIHDILEEQGLSNIRIELIEKYPCNSRHELEKREDDLMLSHDLHGKGNKNRACRSPQQYQKDHPEKCRGYQKKYRETHKELIQKKQHEYYMNNIEKIKKNNQEYRIKNKDKLKISSKLYREKNQEKIKAYATLKVTCNCGQIICKKHLKDHLKTKKHSLNLKNGCGDKESN